MSGNGAISNTYGFFSLKLQEGEGLLKCNFLGYESQTIHLFAKNDTSINISLVPVTFSLNEITVEADRPIVKMSGLNSFTLPVKTIKSIPVLISEADVLKAFQFLPGVHSGTEGTGGLYVRGGGPDQSLYFLMG